ncbi:hypothetical protein QYE76_066182 [Lolium multiflorum]|uniref:Uncharacterized protein n=1 Tax=Lolium multiflorum TaxID=4521 RepID=A0AAD8WBV5_LOLMU|nr:hypothetical protein QYE76_066182 [Lolium multiflorum]
MDKENVNPIVHGAVGSKRDASLFDAVPQRLSPPPVAVGSRRDGTPMRRCPVWTSAATTSTMTSRRQCCGGCIGLRLLLRVSAPSALGLGELLPSRAENIGNTNPKVGSVNPTAHTWRGIRSIQVEISAGLMPRSSPRLARGNKWSEADGVAESGRVLLRKAAFYFEAAPTIDTTVAILMEKNEELSLECDRLRDDLAAKKKNSKTLVELICSLRNERDMLKNELIKQKERNIASTEKASSILKTVCLEKDKSDIEYKILLQDKVKLQKLNLEYADIAILALLERQKAQDKLMHLMLES